jgi:hypothetical protein
VTVPSTKSQRSASTLAEAATVAGGGALLQSALSRLSYLPLKN